MLPSMGGCAGVWAAASAITPASVTATPRRTTRRSTRATLLQTPGRRQRRGQASVPPLHFLPRPLRPDVQVGVEMTIARNPLHGSGRAALPHPALASGEDAKSPQGIGM